MDSIADQGLRDGAQALSMRGAMPQEWEHFARTLGLMTDLLPVVSDQNAKISASSKLRDLGKTPSRYNAAGDVVGIPGWTSYAASERDIARWASDSRLGICVIARRAKAIDIDIAAPVHAAAVLDLIEMGCGAFPRRFRRGTGKCLLPFLLPVDFPKRVIRTAHGNIELLATGQQWLAVGQHKSGTRYEWADGGGVLGLPAKIPELTMAEVDVMWQGLVDAFALPDGASEARSGAMPTKPRDAGDMKDPTVAWLDVNGWVTGYDRGGKVFVRCPWEDGHSTDTGPSSTAWLPAGVGGFAQGHFGCRHASCAGRTDGDFLEAVGYVLDDFDVVELDKDEAEAAAAAAIRNAQRPPTRPPVVLETDIERAKRIEREKSKAIGRDGDLVPLPTQRLMTGSEMLEELVLLEEGTRVSRVSDPRYVLPFEEFKKATAGSVELTKNAAGRAMKVHRAQLWLESRDRKTVRTQTFAPGREPLCLSPDNVPAQNCGCPAGTRRPRTGATSRRGSSPTWSTWCRWTPSASASSTGSRTSSKTPARCRALTT